MPEQAPGPANTPDPNSRLWIPLFEDYVAVAPETGTVEDFMRDASLRLFGYVRDKLVPDLGAIQQHFYETDYVVQLTAVTRSVAAKFLLGLPSAEGITSSHPYTDEPKKFGLILTYGNDPSEFGRYLAKQRSDHYRNRSNLRTSTGMFNRTNNEELTVKDILGDL